jgi:hypothetical protein
MDSLEEGAGAGPVGALEAHLALAAKIECHGRSPLMSAGVSPATRTPGVIIGQARE